MDINKLKSTIDNKEKELEEKKNLEKAEKLAKEKITNEYKDNICKKFFSKAKIQEMQTTFINKIKNIDDTILQEYIEDLFTYNLDMKDEENIILEIPFLDNSYLNIEHRITDANRKQYMEIFNSYDEDIRNRYRNDVGYFMRTLYENKEGINTITLQVDNNISYKLNINGTIITFEEYNNIVTMSFQEYYNYFNSHTSVNTDYINSIGAVNSMIPEQYQLSSDISNADVYNRIKEDSILAQVEETLKDRLTDFGLKIIDIKEENHTITNSATVIIFKIKCKNPLKSEL